VAGKNDKIEPLVAAFWQTCFNNLCKEFKSLSSTLNDKLTCCHGRKGANQRLAETSSIGGLAQTFRTN